MPPTSFRRARIRLRRMIGLANLALLGTQTGVLSDFAPPRGKGIARIAPSEMICGFVSHLHLAGLPLFPSCPFFHLRIISPSRHWSPVCRHRSPFLLPSCLATTFSSTPVISTHRAYPIVHAPRVDHVPNSRDRRYAHLIDLLLVLTWV